MCQVFFLCLPIMDWLAYGRSCVLYDSDMCSYILYLQFERDMKCSYYFFEEVPFFFELFAFVW
jgi:hypothetical protein